MDQAGPLHPFRESDHVLSSDHIGAQGAFQSRIESNIAGRIDNDVEVLGYAIRLLFSKAEIIIGNIAADDGHLVANEILERCSVSFAHGIERLGRDHVVPESRFRLFLRARPHGHIHAANIRKAMQQHAERHFPEKAGAADQKDPPVIKDFGWRQLVLHNVLLPLPLGEGRGEGLSEPASSYPCFFINLQVPTIYGKTWRLLLLPNPHPNPLPRGERHSTAIRSLVWRRSVSANQQPGHCSGSRRYPEAYPYLITR